MSTLADVVAAVRAPTVAAAVAAARHCHAPVAATAGVSWTVYFHSARVV